MINKIDSYMELFKVMLAGDVSTGKTSFLTQLIYQTPDKNPLPNQMLTFFALRITNPDASLQIWDSPGDPRFHYQVISSLASFTALLVFVDITNSHTLNCAQTLIDEVQCYPKLQIHIIESKSQLTLKDPIKRKVSVSDLQKLALRVKGKLFHYCRNQSVQPILHEIIRWKRPQLPAQSNQTNNGQLNQLKSQHTACQCQIF